jgi:pimeloyl-ACP methyl ester carboxylesterase
MKNIIAKIIGLKINIIDILFGGFASKIALTIFSKPFKGRNKEIHSDFLDTAFIEDLSYDDIPVRTYRWLGKKQTVLLAHGWESNTYRWNELIGILKKLDYNIIGVDAPAHGRSGSRRFNAILYSEFIHVAAKRFKANVIIGHSVGGMSALIQQQKYKNPHLKKIVLLGSPSNFTGILNRYAKLMGYTNNVKHGIDKLIEKRFGNPSSFYNTANYAKNIEPIGLIIHDENDKVVPYSDAKDYALHYTNSKLITTKACGHSLNNQTVFNHIIEFLES